MIERRYELAIHTTKQSDSQCVYQRSANNSPRFTIEPISEGIAPVSLLLYNKSSSAMKRTKRIQYARTSHNHD